MEIDEDPVVGVSFALGGVDDGTDVSAPKTWVAHQGVSDRDHNVPVLQHGTHGVTLDLPEKSLELLAGACIVKNPVDKLAPTLSEASKGNQRASHSVPTNHVYADVGGVCKVGCGVGSALAGKDLLGGHPGEGDSHLGAQRGLCDNWYLGPVQIARFG